MGAGYRDLRRIPSLRDRAEVRGSVTGGESLHMLGLVLLHFVAAAIATGVVFILSFNSDACSESGTCNFELGAVSLYLPFIAAVVVATVGVIGGVRSARRSRSASLPLTIGLLIVMLAGGIAIGLNLAAFT
ncbi:hypothetical protein [Lacisediminihabitans changchengi]|uniref:Uncharacterized protein n=1 Tax=Lacisediminihabitans changchengi TaxID=2787634 RepID=A0A934SMH5_9MICO|nr:hypothetical protein [Lacisediminihabitans changchengi]MBK4347697.1 hypothetical protein [Lacisediminihabitans changchengi]